jgi:hypothetical protein
VRLVPEEGEREDLGLLKSQSSLSCAGYNFILMSIWIIITDAGDGKMSLDVRN